MMASALSVMTTSQFVNGATREPRGTFEMTVFRVPTSVGVQVRTACGSGWLISDSARCVIKNQPPAIADGSERKSPTKVGTLTPCPIPEELNHESSNSSCSLRLFNSALIEHIEQYP